MFSDIENRFKDTKIALIVVCHYLDIFFSEELYESIKGNANFSFGSYLRLINGTQYKSKNFTNSLLGIVQDGLKGAQTIAEEKETKWSSSDLQNKKNAIEAIGYDPFEGYSETDRKFLFNEIVKYFDEDISDDAFKLSQVIQIVNNNNQIRNIDLSIAQMSTSLNLGLKSDDIKNLISVKNQLVTSNDKIAKENEISVKNRSNKDVGKSTLGKLQVNLRKMNFEDAEENFYKQLSSRGTSWAVDMSHKSIVENAMFDENDKQEIFNTTRENYINSQRELDDMKEKYRLLLKEYDTLKCEVINNK